MNRNRRSRVEGVATVADSGALEPLPSNMRPEAKALASELRTLLAGLDISMTRYAARVFRDKSVISRYLSGERIPDWQFVHELLVQSTLKQSGTPPTREVISHLKRLHRATLEAGGTPHHKITLLKEQLSEADAAAQRAMRRELELELALQKAQHRIAEMDISLRELEETIDYQQMQHTAELDHIHSKAGDERQALILEIAHLRRELEDAHRRRLNAEARTTELEHQLEEIDQQSNGSEQDLVAALLDYSERVANALSRMNPNRSAEVLETMALGRALALLEYMTPQRAASVFDHLDPTHAAALLDSMRLDMAIDTLKHIPPETTATMLAYTSSNRASEILDRALTARSAAVLAEMDPDRASEILDRMSFDIAAAVLELMSPGRAACIMDYMNTDGVVAALISMNTEPAVARISEMDPGKIANALGMAPYKTAAAMLNQIDKGLAVRIFDLLDPERIGSILEEMHPSRISESLEDMHEDWVKSLLLGLSMKQLNLVFDLVGPVESGHILGRLDPSIAVVLLSYIDPKLASATLKHMPGEFAKTVQESLNISPTTSATAARRRPRRGK